MRIGNINNSIVAENGVVATSQPLAARAGIEILKQGGNAVDAALASAIALTVVEPTSNGIGGDAFAIVWDGNKLQGLNASGKSPKALNLNRIHSFGYKTMPERGWLPVTVPGAPLAWQNLHNRYGKLPFEAIFEPAIDYAENGFEVTPVVVFNWHKAFAEFSTIADPACQFWLDTFSVNGQPPEPGQICTFPDHAKTLNHLLNRGIESFYHGDIAEKIIEFNRTTNGYLSSEDLASHSNIWVDPISINYHGVDVYELPPNGQGLAALMALKILDQQKISTEYMDETFLHAQIEAMKLACADAYQYITDPTDCQNIEAVLLDQAYIESRANLITNKAADPCYGTPPKGGTVYLCTADKNGMMVSYIQSNYDGFGSGVVIPQTGIAMQNRGACFSLDPDHPNMLDGAKRPFHTIIPGFLMQNGKPLGPFGVMGGFMQPQGHLQVVSVMVDSGLDPQSALNMPRWRIIEGKNLQMEKGFSKQIIEQLKNRGHQITIPEDITGFGRGQIIIKQDDKYIAGSDPRADGLALGY